MNKLPRTGLTRLCAIGLTLGSTGMATQAAAQDRMIFGLGAVIRPEYQGSDVQSSTVVPLIEIARGPFFMNMRNGIGLRPLQYGDFKFGASIVYMPGFDLPHALGEISGSAGARFFTDWDRGGINATFGVTKVVAGDLEGVVADVSLSYRYTVTPQLTLIPVIATTWSNRDYNKSYFGVAATQAATSSISAFSLGSGFKDVSIRLTANYELTDRVSLTASATMSKLLGDAKDSPIVFDDTQTFGFIGLSYRFGG